MLHTPIALLAIISTLSFSGVQPGDPPRSPITGQPTTLGTQETKKRDMDRKGMNGEGMGAMGGAMSAEMKQCMKDCGECAGTCAATAHYCLGLGGEHASQQHQGLLQDCAEVCATSACFMARQSPNCPTLCGTCEDICNKCAQACDRMAGSDQMMSKCAEACRLCAASCQKMAAMPGMSPTSSTAPKMPQR